MKVVVNCFDLLDSRAGSGGAGTYVGALLPELARKVELRVIANRQNENQLRKDATYKVASLHENTYQAVAPLLDWADVYFCPLNGISPTMLDSRVPIVSTILDLQHIHFPHYFRSGMFEARHRNYGISVARSDAVLTISAFERENIRRAYGKKAVHVSYLSGYLADAVSGKQSSVSQQLMDQLPWEGKEPYLLYPAVPWPHKNHSRLVQAFDLMRRHHERWRECKLVLTGARSHSLINSAFANIIEQYQLSRHVADLGFVDDSGLAWLMTNAEAIVFPSLYEGFGIPLVDAMKFGVPAIAAASGAVPEVCGQGVAYFSNPLDARAMARDIAAFLDDAGRREKLREEGRQIGTKYSPERTAAVTLECLYEVHNARVAAAKPQAYMPTPMDDYLPRETVTVILDATHFADHETANSAMQVLLDGVGDVSQSLRWVVLMDESANIPAIDRLPESTLRCYVRRDQPGARAIQLAIVRDEIAATTQLLYLCLEEATPAIFRELDYATAMLAALPEIGGVRFDPRADVLWIDTPRTDKKLIDAYEDWRGRPISFFHAMLVGRNGPLASTLWTREGVRDVLSKLQILVLPVSATADRP